MRKQQQQQHKTSGHDTLIQHLSANMSTEQKNCQRAGSNSSHTGHNSDSLGATCETHQIITNQTGYNFQQVMKHHRLGM